MADSHAKMTQATPQEVIISVLAGLLAPLLAIFLIVQLVLSIQGEHKLDTSSAAAQKATLKRIKPFAQLVAIDANAPRVEKAGQEVYDTVCSSCHGSGALGAPKFESKGDWGGRIGQGYDTLIKHAIEGLRQMPPWRKLALMAEMGECVRLLALAGVRRRYPQETPTQRRRRLADLVLGSELARKVYGPLDEVTRC